MKLLFCNRGVAMTELALVLPLLVLIIIGTLEIGRYATLNMKLDRAAATLTDLLTQQEQATEASLQNISLAADYIMKPYEFREGGIIFSSVYTSCGEPIESCSETIINCIVWQYKPRADYTSLIGEPGTITYQVGTVPTGQSVIVVEVFIEYSPMLSLTGDLVSALAPHTLYKYAVFKPRLNNLLSPPG
jgi:Flp pilus assembly protein TadG